MQVLFSATIAITDVKIQPPFANESLWSLDLTFDQSVQSPLREFNKQGTDISSLQHLSPHVASFLDDSLLRDLQTGSDCVESSLATTKLRFLVPAKSGFVVRNDFVERRFECCHLVKAVASFLSPLEQVTAVPFNNNSTSTFKDFLCILSQAIGTIHLECEATFAELDVELENRLSFPWIIAEQLLRRRIAWVQGREDIECISRALEAAAALGITLVILDEPGHWLQNPSAQSIANLREAFTEVDITPDEKLTDRIVQAVKRYPEKIDGIVTISDVRLESVARACEILGLPTERSAAYRIAGDKGETRLLEEQDQEVKESFVLSKAADLEEYLSQRKDHESPLQYPLVVKPVVGWCSDCVTKVRDESELEEAVVKASQRHAESPKQSTAVVVEPYIDGPEVDANFAMLDGEILFFEVNDDFPSPADINGAGGLAANFQETQNVIPSALPEREILAIKEQMRQSVLRQGFRSGVFHCEARVRNSRVHYSVVDGDLVDLVKDNGHGDTASEPVVYLHEVNARPAGYLESVAVLLAYGVDYYALRMMLAIGEGESSRLRSLAQPFLQGPQFHLSVMIIQQTRAGVMKTEDCAKEFLDHPEHASVKAAVVDYYSRKKGGDVLEGPDASALWWIAFFSVTSRLSRRELLEKVRFVQERFSYETK